MDSNFNINYDDDDDKVETGGADEGPDYKAQVNHRGAGGEAGHLDGGIIADADCDAALQHHGGHVFYDEGSDFKAQVTNPRGTDPDGELLGAQPTENPKGDTQNIAEEGNQVDHLPNHDERANVARQPRRGGNIVVHQPQRKMNLQKKIMYPRSKRRPRSLRRNDAHDGGG